MADFSLTLTCDVPDRLVLASWTDAPSAGKPSRLNAPDRTPHRHWRLALSVGEQRLLTAKAIVDGVEAPLDGALDGRLFSWWFVEWSGSARPGIVIPGGQSSLAQILIAADQHQGHFLLGCQRKTSGGGLFLPFDVEWGV